jgi:hypothetical protein
VRVQERRLSDDVELWECCSQCMNEEYDSLQEKKLHNKTGRQADRRQQRLVCGEGEHCMGVTVAVFCMGLRTPLQEAVARHQLSRLPCCIPAHPVAFVLHTVPCCHPVHCATLPLHALCIH